MRPPFLLLLYTILCDLSSVKYILLYVIFTDTTFYETYNHFYTKEPLGIESESLFCFVLYISTESSDDIAGVKAL